MMQLKKVVNHPYLFPDIEPEDFESEVRHIWLQNRLLI